jgi:hypothetical protein
VFTSVSILVESILVDNSRGFCIAIRQFLFDRVEGCCTENWSLFFNSCEEGRDA